MELGGSVRGNNWKYHKGDKEGIGRNYFRRRECNKGITLFVFL